MLEKQVRKIGCRTVIGDGLLGRSANRITGSQKPGKEWTLACFKAKIQFRQLDHAIIDQPLRNYRSSSPLFLVALE